MKRKVYIHCVYKVRSYMSILSILTDFPATFLITYPFNTVKQRFVLHV